MGRSNISRNASGDRLHSRKLSTQFRSEKGELVVSSDLHIYILSINFEVTITFPAI